MGCHALRVCPIKVKLSNITCSALIDADSWKAAFSGSPVHPPWPLATIGTVDRSTSATPSLNSLIS